MFLLFFNLYKAMFVGQWQPTDNLTNLLSSIRSPLNHVGQLLTSIFGDNVTYTTFGEDISYDILTLVSFILALITSIGIVVMSVKGVKKAFGIFFGRIR